MSKTIKILTEKITRFFSSPLILMLWTLAGLLVPNAVLCFTENWSVIAKAANILIPAGIYLLCFSISRKTGRAVWWLFPFIFFAAFEIVLLYLYGEGVIAVDMFLNVFTTSFSEATTLLVNLVMALVFVAILYVVPLVWGGIAWHKKRRISEKQQKNCRKTGTVFTAAGGLLAVAAYLFVPGYNIIDETFPADAISNLCEAVVRTQQMEHYKQTSADFKYQAVSEADPEEKELYIMAIGETGRAMDWQLGGYERETNPRLSKIPGLTYFSRAFSESNTTHKSVPMLMSFASAENFDSIYNYKSVLTAFKEAGYRTAFFSTQTPNRSYTQFFADEADTTAYLKGKPNEVWPYDGELLPLLQAEIAKNTGKLLVVLHTYGSHFLYTERYPSEFAFFKPDNTVDANRLNRDKLINAYDNTIRYTDYVLSQVIASAQKAGCRSAVLYSTDHGEDIFDDSRERFLHASPVPTAYQLHVPVAVWLSDSLIAQSPDKLRALRSHRGDFISPQKSLFMTLLDIASVKTPYYREEWALTSDAFKSPEALYLTDLNEPLPWSEIAFKKQDMKYFEKIIPK